MSDIVRWCRCEVEGKAYYGKLEGEEIVLLRGAPFTLAQEIGNRVRLSQVRLLTPCVPSKVIGVGLNYRAHIAENVSGRAVNTEPTEPILFIKPSTSVIGPGEDIIYPPGVDRLDEEAELGVVIKDRIRRITKEEAQEHILGYTCVNDVSARDYQKKDTQWTRGKGFDSFCPIGPYIVSGINPLSLEVLGFLNGEKKQASNTSRMIFDVYALVAFVSGVMTLLPGDVIATGTPERVAALKPGDEVSIIIENIGTLTNKVVAG
jgi:2-keto-4-pentenoate hydratase/2-oxohepta-3-ene-1,7-dioic acid hydratase in catechol pathway